jgi:hypothetical protein
MPATEAIYANPARDCAGLTIDGRWGRTTTYNLIVAGKLKVVPVGTRRGRTIVLRESIDDYLRSLAKTNQPTAKTDCCAKAS